MFKKLIVLVVISGIVVMILYFKFFRFYITSEYQSLTDNFLVTFISTLLSIIVGISLFKLQSRFNDEQEIKKYKSILNVEISENIRILSKNPTMTLTLRNDSVLPVLVTTLSKMPF